MEAPQGGLEASSAARMASHVADARMLLSFVCRKGVDLAPEVLEPIIQAERLIADGEWAAESEAEFWLAYNELARLARPATVDTIRAAGLAGRDRTGVTAPGPSGDEAAGPLSKILRYLAPRRAERTLVQRCVGRYRVWAFVALVLVILLQAYWAIGTRVLKNLEALESRTEQALQAGAAMAEMQNIKAAREANISILRLTTFGGVIPVRAVAGDADAKAALIARASEVSQSNTLYRQAQEFFNDAVLQFLLPILLGWLGALVYILRSISRQVENVSFSPSSDIRYRMRMYLGAISGLTIAWFVSPDSQSGAAAAISPLALSFVAGYGVELLFAALDRIIGAFTSRTTDDRSTATASPSIGEAVRRLARRNGAAGLSGDAGPESGSAPAGSKISP